MVVRRSGAHALELANANADFLSTRVVAEMGNCVVCHWTASNLAIVETRASILIAPVK